MASLTRNQATYRPRFDRGAWLHLVLMLLWLGLGLGSFIYIFTLPTDGWHVSTPDDFNGVGYIYQENVMGAASGLQPGDHVIAVEGNYFEEGNDNLLHVSDRWRSGNTLQYTLLRGGQEMQVMVPLVQWNAWKFLTQAAKVSDLTGLLSLAILWAMGGLVFWRKPDNPAARALWVLSSVWLTIGFAVPYQALPVNIDPPASFLTSLLITATFTILAPPAFIRFALVFPRPKPIVLRHPWTAFLPYAVGVIGIGAFMIKFYVFGFAWTGLSVLLTIIILLHNAATMRDAASRAQLRWGLGGMILGLGLFFSTYIVIFADLSGPLAATINAFSTLGFGVMGVGLGIAILRYRLFDIDVIIRRTLVYGALSATLALVYFGSVLLLQQALGRLTGVEDSPLAIVISTLLVAALVTPLRRRIQNDIDRRFYRQKYNAEQALAEFALAARSETELETLTGRLVQTVNQTVQPEQANLWLVRRPQDHTP